MKIKKIVSRLQRKIIFLFDGVNTKYYMKWYNSWLRSNGMKMRGNAKYIHHTVFFDGQGYELIELGKNVVISLGVTILVHDFSLEAGLRALNTNNGTNEAHTMKSVKIGDNCFIGANVTILGGATLPKNCIVAAGTILTDKIYPENSIIAGNPGKVIANTTEWAKQKISEGQYEKGYFN